MKKIQSLLLILMIMFVLPVISGCGEEQIRVSAVSFGQGTYTIVQGDTLQLSPTVSPVEANNQTVTYKILSGSAYITLSNTGLVTAKTSLGNETRTSQVQVTTDDGKLTATCYISVIPTAIELTAPTGLVFNPSSSTVSWNAVTYTENNYSASYTLSVTKDGGTPALIENTRVRSYAVTSSGSYVVKVKSIGDSKVFTDSDYTAEYSFTLLPAPETPFVSNRVITVNKITAGDYVTDASDYELVVTKTNSSTPISITAFSKAETETTVSWTIPSGTNDILEAGTYQYKVRVLGDGGASSSDTEYFKSGYSSTTDATFTQLGFSSNLLVENDVATWNAVANAVSYSIYVYTTNLSQPDYVYDDLTATTWELTDEVIALETYTIKVQAVGNGGNILSGLVSSKASQKLETPTNLSISSLNLTWDAVQNATLYKVYVNSSTVEVSSNSATSYTFDNSVFTAGANTIRVVASVADTTSAYISSEAGTLSVTKLVTPTLTTNNGNIAWSGVSDVTQYYLSLTPSGSATQNFTLSNSTLTYNLGNTYNAGTYFVTVQAKGNGTNVLDSSASLQQEYTKMSAPVISSVTEAGILSWTKGTYASSSNTFQVIIRDPTGVLADVTLSTTGLSYNVGQYLTGSGYGKYYFILKSVNNLSAQKYLTSEESTGVTTYKLTAPTGLTVSGGKLAWTGITSTIEGTNISSLFDYKIKIDTDESQTTPNTILIPSSASCYAGTHTAWVKTRILSTASNQVTINGVTAYLIGSDYSTGLSFTKLSTPSVPAISDEVISGTVISGVTNYTLTVTKPSNEQRTYDVSAASTKWSTTVSDIFNSIGTVSAGTYTVKVSAKGGDLAVDSDLSGALTVYKLQSPTLSVSNGKLMWNLVYSNLYNNIVPITSYQIGIREDEGDDWTVYIPDSGATSWSMSDYSAGTYQVRIIANGTSSRILTSQSSDVITVEKLESVDISTLAIDQSNEQFDSLTWTEIADAGYLVSVYQVYTTTTVLKEQTTVATNSFEFSEDYTVSDYLISIQTVASDKVSGDATMLFGVSRLQQVTGINIAENGDISWDSVSGANKYLMYINDELIPDSQVNSTTRVAKLLSGNDPILTSNNTGTLSVQIVAVIDGATYSTPVNGEITISGAPSVAYNVFRYVAPTLSVTNGSIVWNNSNSNNYGYELTFTTAGVPTTISIAQNVNTYNMSALSASTNYAVSITALGNGGIYLESPAGDLVNTVQKLAEPTYSVTNGVLTWAKNTNAQSYRVTTTGSGKTIITPDLKPISSAPTVVTLPVSSVAGMSGAITFTIQAIGTGSITDEGTVYVNSTVNTTNTIYKHATPTGLTVIDGEIYWTRASTRESVVNSVSYPVLNGYNVIFGENNQDVAESNLNEAFILSDYITTKSTLKIQVCALGNNGGSASPAGTVYLNSDYTSSMTVIINGRPENLGITDGVLTWTENAQITGTFSDYEILVKKNTGTTSVLSSVNSNALDTVSGTINSISVRHKGTTTSTTGTKYVNSAVSDAITNIKKLGSVTGSVNTEGEFIWNAEDFVFAGYTAGITFTVNDISDETTGHNSTASTFILSGEYGLGSTTVSAQLAIKAYATGSGDVTDTDTAGYCYLNSTVFNLDAYRFAPVTAFTIEDGLKLVWDANSTIINGVQNDRFMIEFKLGEDAGNSEADWQYRMVDDLSEIPLWTLGAYEARISVLSTSANVIRSVTVNCDLTEDTPYLFNKFEAGEGTPEYPFIISTTAGSDTVEASTAETKLGYVNIIPSAYFKLTEDIVLTSQQSDDYATNLCTIAEQNSPITITGGINGDGHTISNYEIYSSSSITYLWYGLKGQAREGFSSPTLSASNFYGHSGVICNLNLEISRCDISLDNRTSQPTISFFSFISMGGWIINCDISLANTLSEIVIDDIACDFNIVYGGFVGYMFSSENSYSEESEKFDRDARIMDCTSNVNISLTKGANYLNSATLLGGIVGYNYGGSLYNCRNNGTLGGTQVGGIALYCGKISIYTEINGEWVYGEKSGLISGCTNTGNLTSYPIKTSDGDEHRSYSGGIVGTLQYSDIVYCLNTGNMTAVSGNNNANEQDFTQITVIMGGLIGQFDSGVMINCLSTSQITIGDYISPNSLSGTGSQLGGLIGENTSGTFSYSYYDKTLSNYTDVGGVDGNNSGKTTIELQNSGFVSGNFLSNPATEIGEYYDEAFGFEPVFVYVSGSYPALNWIEIA